MLNHETRTRERMRQMRNIVCHQSFIINPHIKRFKGRPEELKSDANFLTDASELRSNSMKSTLAAGISLTIASLTSLPAAIFLTPIITWTPRNARTRVVSEPRPLDAPETDRKYKCLSIHSGDTNY